MTAQKNILRNTLITEKDLDEKTYIRSAKYKAGSYIGQKDEGR